MNADQITLADAIATFTKADEAHTEATITLSRYQRDCERAYRRVEITGEERIAAHATLTKLLGEAV